MRCGCADREKAEKERKKAAQPGREEAEFVAGGGEGPQVETKAGWDVDGVEIRIILDFGAGFNDWRGWYANAGA